MIGYLDNKKMTVKAIFFFGFGFIFFFQLTWANSFLTENWLRLDLGILVVLLLLGFPFRFLLFLTILGGLWLDVYLTVPFGFNVFVGVFWLSLLFWFAKEKLSVERNLFSSLVFIFSAFLLFYLLSGSLIFFWEKTVAFSFFRSFVLLNFWKGILLNVFLSLLLFFGLNFINVKTKFLQG